MPNTAWNPLDCHSRFTLSGGNLVATAAALASDQGVAIADGKSSGLYYIEITVGGTFGGNACLGVNTLSPAWSAAIPSDSSGCYCYASNGSIFYNGGSSGFTLGAFAAGNVICIAVDLTNNKIWWRKGAGNWDGNATHNPATNTGGISIATLVATSRPWFVIAGAGTSGAPVYTLNAGDSTFTQTVPSGFTAGWPDNGAVTSGAAFDPASATAAITLSNSNLTASASASPPTNQNIKGTGYASSGKYYWEYNINAGEAGTFAVGIADANTLTTSFYTNATHGSIVYKNGSVWVNGVSASITIPGLLNGVAAGVAVDLAAQLLWWRVNAGTWNASGTANPATGTGGINISALSGGIYPALAGSSTSGVWRVSMNPTNYTKIPAPAGFTVGPPPPSLVVAPNRQYAVSVIS